VLGIGLRVAGRVAGEHISNSTPRPGGPTVVAPQAGDATVDAAVRGRAAGRAAARAPGGLGRGIAGFLRPFGRVGGILWLEVMGVFFLLPLVVFGPTLWRIRADWAQGPNHKLFVVTAGVIVLFVYLSVSSFWRARKKSAGS
jgi:hypothetical protein